MSFRVPKKITLIPMLAALVLASCGPHLSGCEGDGDLSGNDTLVGTVMQTSSTRVLETMRLPGWMVTIAYLVMKVPMS